MNESCKSVKVPLTFTNMIYFWNCITMSIARKLTGVCVMLRHEIHQMYGDLSIQKNQGILDCVKANYLKIDKP